MFRPRWTLAVLGLVVALLDFSVFADQRKFQQRSCGISAGAQCEEGSCTCTRWLIEWRRSDGVVTGVSIAATLEAVEKARDRDLEVDRLWARMLNISVNENPGPPICDLCNPQRNTTAAPTAASQVAARLFEEWTRKAAEELQSFVSALPGLLNSPGQAFMRGLIDHANAWRQSIADAKHLRREMLLVEAQANRVAASLDAATAALKNDLAAIESTFRALPPNIQQAIRGHGQETAEQLRVWVRENFRRVVGRDIDDATLESNVRKLLAFQERGQLQETKDFFLNVEWPSLRR